MSRRLAREDGQAIILVALASAVMLAVVGLVIDGSRLFVDHRQLQTAADAAALAGAWDVAHNNAAAIEGDVNWYATKNGWTGPHLDKCVDTPASRTPTAGRTRTSTRAEVIRRRSRCAFRGRRRTTSVQFLHLGTSHVRTRAVASLASGQAPPFTFVALQSDGEHHTLLVKNASTLNVANSLYTNSCGDVPWCQGGGNSHDSFDVFGDGGTIRDAHDIFVVGGWETKDGNVVGANGGTCIVGNSVGPYSPNVKTAVALTTLTTNFKITGVAERIRPRRGRRRDPDKQRADARHRCHRHWRERHPDRAARLQQHPDCDPHNNTVINKVAVHTAAYNPNIHTAAAMAAGDTSFQITGVAAGNAGPVEAGDVIKIGNEQMRVQPTAGGGQPA